MVNVSDIFSTIHLSKLSCKFHDAKKILLKLQTVQCYTLLKFRVAVAKGPYLSSLQEMEAVQVTAVLSTVT